MKVACPTCGRNTAIEVEVGDFPMRCQRCGGLLRRPAEGTAADRSAIRAKRPRGLAVRLSVAPPAARRGQLAMILSTRPSSDESPPPVIRTGPGAHAAVVEDKMPRPALSLAERRARQKALRRALLRGEMQALGALGWVGLAFVASLALFVLALQVHAIWKHPAPLRADTLHADVP